MEKLGDTSERQIMPQNLFRHYIEGRRNARFRTGESTYIPDISLPGFKVFRWQNPNLPFYYEDRFSDNNKRPGNFGGFEINRANSEKGEILTLYNYCGGLTKEGLKVGEIEVYDNLLQRFLEEHDEIRFGKKVRFTIERKDGVWVYEGKGKVEDYGWADDESISLNGVEMYKLRGTGHTFVQGF